MEKLGENIRFFREQLQLTQQELADQLNISRSVLTKWENANLVPDIQTLLKLSHIFEVSLDELVGSYEHSHLIYEMTRKYNLEDNVIDEQMLEIINYLKRNADLKEGLFELSQLTRKNRRPIEEIIKVIFHELLGK